MFYMVAKRIKTLVHYLKVSFLKSHILLLTAEDFNSFCKSSHLDPGATGRIANMGAQRIEPRLAGRGG
jgi:hypothetical protein